MGADGGGGGAPGGAPGAQMVLYQHPPAWGLPTSCPRCLAAQVLLRFAAGAGLGGAGGAQESDAFAAFSFETDSGGNASLSPTGSLPALEDGEAFVGGYGGVREHVRSARSADVDAWMPAAAAAQRAAFEALVENRLAPATEAALWARRENYRAVSKPAYAAAHAWPLGSILALQRRRAALAALPHGSTEESLTSAAVEAVGNLAAFLDDKRYLFGAHPTSLDATVLGQLLVHMWAPLPHHPLRDAIGARPNLVAYARRCAQECFGALEPPLVGEDGVIGGAGARPKLAKERKKGKEAYTPAEQAYHRNSKWYMTGIAVLSAAYGLYTLAYTDEQFERIHEQIEALKEKGLSLRAAGGDGVRTGSFDDDDDGEV